MQLLGKIIPFFFGLWLGVGSDEVKTGESEVERRESWFYWGLRGEDEEMEKARGREERVTRMQHSGFFIAAAW